MKAAVVEQAKKLVVRELPEPEMGDYEARCALLYGAVCAGTDTHLFQGHPPFCHWIKPPFILGHESVGEVVEIGAKVRNLKPGDRIIRVGSPAVGGVNAAWGGFAETGIATDWRAMQEDGLDGWTDKTVQQILPPDIDPAVGTLIITWRETLSYTMRMGIRPGSAVLVVGSGGNGLAFASHARNLGAATVTLIGSGGRAAEAKRAGATTFHDYRSEHCWEQVRETAPEGYDTVIDAIGKAGTAAAAQRCLKPGGMIGVYGLDEHDSVRLVPDRTFTCYAGGYDEAEAHDHVLAFYRAGKLDPSVWINRSHVFTLDTLGEALDAVQKRQCVKPLVILKKKALLAPTGAKNILLATLLLACASVAAAVTMPEREAFWSIPPKADPQTLALWTFDGTAAGADDSLEDFLTAAALGKGEGPTALPGAGRSGGMANAETVGTVGSSDDGFFGKAAVLDGRGFLRSKTVRFRESGQATVELQIRPQAGQGEAILLDFPSASVPCRIVRTADGTLRLEGRDDTSLTHPRAAPDAKWTHVALSFPCGGGIEFLVDGLAVAPADADARAFPATAPQLGDAFVVGAQADGSETGRFHGLIDTVRVMARAANFYVLEEMPQADPALPPLPTPAPPWFAYAKGALVSIPFDGATPAVTGVETVRAPAAFIAGIRGQAAAFAKDDAAFAGTAILPAARGTLSLWFRPLDWNNFAQYSQYGDDGPVPRLRLLSFTLADAPETQALRTLTLGKGVQQPQFGLPQPWVPLHPGRWTHVVCTWDGAETTLYLDGKKQALGQAAWAAVERNKDAHKTMEEAWRQNESQAMRLVFHRSGTAVDAVAIYPWAFTDEEAANDYVRVFPAGAKRMVTLAPIRLYPEYDYYNARLMVGVRALPHADREPDAVRVSVHVDGQPFAGASAQVELPANGRVRVTLPAPLEFDRPYTLHAEAFIGDTAVAAYEMTYRRVAPVWWRNTLGQTRDVPAPWTPIVATGNERLDVWGRTLTLAPGGLPATLSSAGAELLSAPFRLHGTTPDGTVIELTGATMPTFVETAPDQARWTGTLAGDGITAEVEGELAYDGLIRLRVTLRPDGKPVALGQLLLDVPLQAEHAEQIIANGGGSNFRASWDARLVPAGEGCVWNGREAIKHKAMAVGHFLPIVWLGDDQRGLCFYGDNDRGWTPNPDEASQEVWREGETVLYRMRLVSQSLTLDAPRTIEFFVHPTPTKPLDDHWRAYNRGVPPVPGYEGIDAFISPTLTAPSNLPTHAGITFELEPASWEDAAANSLVLRQRAGPPGSPRLFYIDCSWPRLGPSMKEFMHAGLFARGRMTWTREVEDYMVWIINEYIRRDLIDGIYIDDTSLGSTLMTEATAYRLEDGTVQPGFNTMGFRRFLQRIWVLYAAQGQRARIMPHMTYCYEIPALSFADAAANGEDRDIHPYAKDTFADRWPYEQLRVLSGSEKFGFVHFWKAGVDPNKAKTPRGLPEWMFWQNRAMKGWLMLQDTEVAWGAKIGAKELLAFGAQEPDARFVRDEEASAWFRPVITPVRVAAYLRNQRALIIVFNPDSEERTVTLNLDRDAFFRGASAFTWRDAESDILPPGSGQPTEEDIRGAAKLKSQRLSLEAPALDADALDDLLDPKSPQQREQERLALKAEGARVTLPVRGKDFRMLILSWQGE